MCKCLQYCLESCYWHLIEKRFCYDETIAMYEDPEKDEKNNNFFDNMTFYDSVSVIAGRAIVTIDPVPADQKPIVQQPTRKIRFQNEEETDLIDKPVPPVILETVQEHEVEKPTQLQTLTVENLEPKRKTLRERRMSKSLYLKIEQTKEVPLVQQQYMPKFYLDTPAPEDQVTTSMFRAPSTALASPIPKADFDYDLFSVVQIEKVRTQENAHLQRKESDRSSRLLQIREKVKLKRSKSSLGTSVTNLPHSHHHI